MSIFKNKEEETDEEELEELEEKRFNRRKFKDLNPQNKRKRKEPPKPWGKKERIIVLSILLLTVLISLFLDLSSRNFKLPGLPRLKLIKPGFDIFEDKTIIIGNRREEQVAMKEKIIKEFNDKTKELSGVYALYVVNLDNNHSFGEGEDEIMQAASLIKLPVIASLYKEAEEGRINLDTKYFLKGPDRVAGSGSLSAKPVGTVYTYRELANLMGKQSDNTAFGIIRKILGDEKINMTAEEIGMTKTSLKDNKTTARDVGIFFQKLYQGEVVSEAHKDEILDSLTDTIYEDWMAAGIPDEVKVSHKFGKEVHVVNDAGIIFTDKPFVLVIMTDGVVEKEADAIFPELARMVYIYESTD